MNEINEWAYTGYRPTTASSSGSVGCHTLASEHVPEFPTSFFAQAVGPCLTRSGFLRSSSNMDPLIQFLGLVRLALIDSTTNDATHRS